jgi:hypothetical protein
MATPGILDQGNQYETGELFDFDTCIDPLELAAQALAKLKVAGLNGVLYYSDIPNNVIEFPLRTVGVSSFESAGMLVKDNKTDLENTLKPHLAIEIDESITVDLKQSGDEVVVGIGRPGELSGKKPRKELAEDDPRHGKATTYGNYACRCRRCTEAWRIYHREYLHRSGRNKPLAKWREEQAINKLNNPPEHGTESRYGGSYKCRCEQCRKAATEARRQRRNANPEASRLYDKRYRASTIRRSIGDEDRSLIRRAEELAAVRADATGELAELYRDQEKDDKFGHIIHIRPWLLSLNGLDRYGREMLETLVVEDGHAVKHV